MSKNPVSFIVLDEYAETDAFDANKSYYPLIPKMYFAHILRQSRECVLGPYMTREAAKAEANRFAELLLDGKLAMVKQKAAA